MEMKTKVVRICQCKRCGFEWQPRVKKPRVCSRCKSHQWEKEKNK